MRPSGSIRLAKLCRSVQRASWPNNVTMPAQPFPRLNGGSFRLTEAPGIGVEPDLEAVAPFLVAKHEAS